MKQTDIYQTLEDRHNDCEIESNGPFFCSEKYPNGNLKKGVKEPWLGEGYYFWDTRIEDAKWWGNTIYGRKGYIICHTTYDQHSSLLYDLVGNVEQFDEFVECAKFIKQNLNIETIKFPFVLKYLKKNADFNYKAIRVWPQPQNIEDTAIKFPGYKTILGKADKIQICFFDKTLLTQPYHIVYKQSFLENQTI